MKSGKIIYSPSVKEFCKEYANAMNNKELVLHPCECNYCISFDFFDERLRKRVDELKGRSSGKRYVAIIPSIESLAELNIKPNSLEKEFMKRYWPGLLKIAFNRKYCIGIPKQKWLRDCLDTIRPLVGITSANSEGLSPVTRAQELEEKLLQGVDRIFISDRLIYARKQSTIVRLKKGVEILRQGEVILDENPMTSGKT